MALAWIVVLVIVKLWQYDDFNKKVRKRDNDPNYYIKSNNWYRIHGK